MHAIAMRGKTRNLKTTAIALSLTLAILSLETAPVNAAEPADDSPVRLREKLAAITDLPDAERAKTVAEIAARKGILEKLEKAMFPPVDTLLKMLGADEYATREFATNALANAGNENLKKVEALFRSTKDPEVKTRCATILKRLRNGKKNASQPDPLTLTALEIFLDAPPDGKNGRPFLLYYFRHLNKLPESLRKKLGDAAKRCFEDKELEKAIADIAEAAPENSPLANALNEALKKAAGKSYAKRAKAVEAWKKVTKIDIIALADEWDNKNSFSMSEFHQFTNKLRKVDGFPLVKEKYIEYCLDTGRAFPIIEATFLMRDGGVPDSLADKYIKTLISMQEENTSFLGDCFYRIPHVKPLYKKHVWDFISNGQYELRNIGLFIAAGYPGEFKDKIHDLALQEDYDSYPMLYMLYFPEEKKTLIKALVEDLKRSNPIGRNPADKLALLGDRELAREAILAKAKQGQADFEEYFDFVSLIKLNLPPGFVVKSMANNQEPCFNLYNVDPNIIVESLKKCPPKTWRRDKDLILNFILKNMAFSDDCSPLIIAWPELFERFLAKLMAKGAGRNSNFYYYLDEGANTLAAALDARPELRKTLDSAIKYDDGEPIRRFIKAMILTRSKKFHEEGEKLAAPFLTTKAFKKLNIKPFVGPFEVALANPAVSDDTYLAAARLLLENKPKDLGDISDKLLARQPRKIILPLLKETLAKKENKELPPPARARIYDLAFRIDPNDDELRKTAVDEILAAPIANATPLLKVLLEHGIGISYPEKAMAKLPVGYKSVHAIALVAKVDSANAERAIPFFKRSIKKGNPLWNLEFEMLECPALAKALLPLFHEKLMKDHSYQHSARILKHFPDSVAEHAEEIRKTYEKLDDPKDIDLFTALILAMPLETLKTFSDAVEKKYAGAGADREAVYLEYLRARTAETPEARKRAADAYFARLEKDLHQPVGCSFVYDAYRLAREFPGKFEKFAILILDRGAYYQQCDLVRALGAEKNWDGTPMKVFSALEIGRAHV